MAIKLVNLNTVKNWLGSTNGNDDLLLNQLIERVSRAVLSFIERPNIFLRSCSDFYDGENSVRIILRTFPVISIQSVAVNAASISAAPLPQTTNGSGYFLDPWDGNLPGAPQSLTLFGHRFCKGLANVNIQYTAGYGIQGEAHAVPASGTYSLRVNEPQGRFGLDGGVTYASNGVALTSVPYVDNIQASLTTGQYSVDPKEGLYFFAAGDANANVLITYSYIPSDLAQAVLETIGERYRYKSRIGEKSKSLGGQETVTFDTSDLTKAIRLMLMPYKSMMPLS